MKDTDDSTFTFTRRGVLAGGGLTVLATVPAEGGQAQKTASPHATIPIELTVNGKRHTLSVDPRTTLLDLLRERIALTGTKKGCDHGQCGACTVHVDGKAQLSCLIFAASVDGEVTTVEGLARAEALHPMQQAFIDHDAFQCGYCTPGQIMSAVALANRTRRLDADHVREAMSGNLCRCAAYPNVVAAVLDGARRMRRG